MTSFIADVVWPALYLEERLLSLWVIAAGLIVEYVFVWRITTLGPVKAILADLAMNAASTILGLILIPVLGLAVAIVPGELVGTFSPITWTLTFLVAVILNAWIESLVLWKIFKQPFATRQFWWLILANAISVGIALGSFLIFQMRP